MKILKFICFLLVASTLTFCESDDTNPESETQNEGIVGIWDFTKYTTEYEGEITEYTPNETVCDDEENLTCFNGDVILYSNCENNQEVTFTFNEDLSGTISRVFSETDFDEAYDNCNTDPGMVDGQFIIEGTYTYNETTNLLVFTITKSTEIYGSETEIDEDPDGEITYGVALNNDTLILTDSDTEDTVVFTLERS